MNIVARIKFAVAAIVILLLFATDAHAEKRVALVIGNSAYQHIPRLPNPANDARLVGNTLRGLQFTLVGGGAQIDLDIASLNRVVRTFREQLSGADVGLFYYAGHGMQIKGQNYLVPVDANPTVEADVDFQMLDMNVVLRQMESTGTKLNLVILDACRNNPFGGRGLRSATSGLATMQAPEGTLISFATQPGNVALDGSGGNSPYTTALVHSMRKPGLGIFRAFNDVGLSVSQVTAGAQKPWMSSSPIKGDFYFSPPRNTPAPSTEKSPATVDDRPARAWDAVKTTSDQTVLQAFIREYPNSVYAALAVARLKELNKMAMRTPAETPDRLPAPPPPTRAEPEGFLFPDSDRRNLSRNELRGLSPAQLRIARNEIYARRGRFFKSADLNQHFRRFSWYRPNTWNPSLNAYERANVQTIQSMER